MKISFYGGSQGVTGSNYLLETDDTKILIDCGLFQGGDEQEKKNWETLAYDPAQINYIVATHSHIDHIGRLPMLYKQGFRGKVIATGPVKAFSQIFLEDTCGLMGRTANNLGVSELFNQQDVDGVISLFETYPYGEIVKAGGAEITLHDAGHILGSSIVEIRVEGKTIIFSGDLGNPPVPLLRDTELIKSADYVVMESTYGDRDHAPAEQKKVELERAVEDTVAKGGVLLMPSFAMERTQEILYELSDLKRNKRIPDIPIYLDSPLAIKATNIYKQFSEFYDEEAKKLLSSGKNFFDFPGLTFVEKSDQSIELDQDKSPKVIIAGSGMSNGGRIVNHEKIYLPIESTTLLIVGFQVEGTLGRRLRDGTKDVRIMGEDVTVRATVRPIESYSAHADQKRLLYWLSSIESPIKKVFLVHGEDTAKQALMGKIAQDLGQETVIPKEGESYEI